MTRIDKIEDDLKNLQTLVLEQQKEISDLRRQLTGGRAEYQDGAVAAEQVLISEDALVLDMPSVTEIPDRTMEASDSLEDEAVEAAGMGAAAGRNPAAEADVSAAGQQSVAEQTVATNAAQSEWDSSQSRAVENVRAAQQRREQEVRQREQAVKDIPKVDMEKKMGGMMGIVASVMIFISIIFFVTMVYGELSKPLKVACIFIFSFALLGLGIHNMRKKVNGFTMSLTGCGMGAVYLSLFITHIYFGYMNQILLYLLIVVWAVGVYYFFGKDYGAFKIVGQVGIAMSALFGFGMIISSGYYGERELVTKLMFLVIFFSVTAWFYLLVDKKCSDTVTTVCILLDEISMLFFFGLLFSYGVWKMLLKAGRMWVMVYMACILLNMLMFLWKYVFMERQRENQTTGTLYVPLLIFSEIIMYSTISKCMEGLPSYVCFIAAVPILAALIWVELSRRRKDMVHLFSAIAIYILLFFATANLEGTGCISLIWIAYGFVLLSVGYRFLDRAAVYLSYASLVLAVYYLMDEQWIVPKAAVCVAVAAYAAWKLYAGHEMYHVRLKLALYPILQLVLYCVVFASLGDFGMKQSLCGAWGYIFCAAMSMAACQKFFQTSFDEDESFEDSVNRLALGINGILMAWGSSLMFGDYNNVMRFVILAVVLAVYLVNVGPVFGRYGDNLLTGVYNGLKLTIYVRCVLKAYETSGPVVSLCWVALAIVFIVTGFRLEYKYLRVYGLWLTMFSVCKLLIADITYETAAVRTLSFLISGVLCFIINLIYNNAKKE